MTPADLLGPYLSAEWDARKLSLADAAAVASFPDTSVASGARTGPSVNGTQTNGSLQPAYSATGLNGYPCVVGNGSQWLDLSNVASLPSGTNPVTIITLAQGVRAGPGNRVLLQWGSGFYGSPSNHLWGQKGSSNSEPWWYTDYGGGTDDTYGLTDIVDSPSLAILGIARAGTPLGTLAVNDSQEYSKSWGNSPIGSTSGRLFYTTTGDCNPFIGKLGYGAVVSRLITPAEWQKLDAILLWGFGLQAKLAADNPDRNAAPTVDDGVAIIRRRPVMLLAS